MSTFFFARFHSHSGDQGFIWGCKMCCMKRSMFLICKRMGQNTCFLMLVWRFSFLLEVSIKYHLLSTALVREAGRPGAARLASAYSKAWSALLQWSHPRALVRNIHWDFGRSANLIFVSQIVPHVARLQAFRRGGEYLLILGSLLSGMVGP